jgi:hypothetical protein
VKRIVHVDFDVRFFRGFAAPVKDLVLFGVQEVRRVDSRSVYTLRAIHKCCRITKRRLLGIGYAVQKVF